MNKTVTATEAKNQLGALLNWVKATDDSVVIEHRGNASFALISMRSYEEYLDLIAREKKERLLESLRRVREEGNRRNSDLSEDEAMEMAVQAVREIRTDMSELRLSDSQLTKK